jgi:tungstate transport system ATP-binding protein
MPDGAILADAPDARSRTGTGVILPLFCRGVVVARGGRVLLDQVDLTIDGGGLSVIMGANGAGKTLLLRVLANLTRPESGTVRWGGKVPSRALAPKVGVVFQKPVLLRRSVLQNVKYALAAAGVGRGARDDRARDVLEMASLSRLAQTPARVLSGGEQQRLALARALAAEPEVLLLDEPTSSLDPAATLAIEKLIEDIRRRGTRLVLITHDVGQARRLADEVQFMHHGRIVECGPANTFFQAPQSAPAQAFLEGRIFL